MKVNFFNYRYIHNYIYILNIKVEISEIATWENRLKKFAAHLSCMMFYGRNFSSDSNSMFPCDWSSEFVEWSQNQIALIISPLILPQTEFQLVLHQPKEWNYNQNLIRFNKIMNLFHCVHTAGVNIQFLCTYIYEFKNNFKHEFELYDRPEFIIYCIYNMHMLYACYIYNTIDSY